MIEGFLKTAVLIEKGNQYEAFEAGQVFEHHWGRTLNEGDNSLFCTLTLNFNPLYFNRPYAIALGYRDIVVNPLLAFNVVLGLSVEDLSEHGGPFVGIQALKFHVPVYAGDTLTARSTTTECRLSASQPGAGLVTWHTQGFNQDGVLVLDYKRTNIFLNRST